MKKILCVLTAVFTLGCLAGCTAFKDHDDGKCDKCDASLAFQIDGEGKDELCAKCWFKKGVEEW